MPIYDVRLFLLKISEVVSLLLNPPSHGVATLPPIEPKGGKVYVYQGKLEKHKGLFCMHIDYAQAIAKI